MPRPKLFNLHRVSPNGWEAPLVLNISLTKACQYVGLSLHDNGRANKAEAQAFARTLPADGTVIEHASGSRYWIDPA